jgi:hypothetical protein
MPNSVQQDAEEMCEGIPEFSISQSVAAKVTVMSENKMITMYPELSFLLLMWVRKK